VTVNSARANRKLPNCKAQGRDNYGRESPFMLIMLVNGIASISISLVRDVRFVSARGGV